MKLSNEEMEAMARYGNGIVRSIPTTVDVSQMRAALANLRHVSKQIESGKPGRAQLHDLWKALDWIETAFPTGMQRLLKKPHRARKETT